MKSTHVPFLLAAVLAASPAMADSDATAAEQSHADYDHGASGEHYYPNHVGVFAAGLTSNLDHHTNSYTLGFDYERRLGPLGVGGLADFVFAGHRETILAGALTAHPGGGLKLLAAAGKLFVDDHSYFLKRLGAGYDLHFGRGSITPTLSLDLVHGEKTLVYGVVLGVGF